LLAVSELAAQAAPVIATMWVVAHIAFNRSETGTRMDHSIDRIALKISLHQRLSVCKESIHKRNLALIGNATVE
jgi:hypothetical protein